MSYLRPAVLMLILLSLITGVAYPLLTNVLSLSLFNHQAKGSLVYKGDTLVGSQLIGQNFSQPGYFWGRPSATSDSAYNGMSSGGSNLAVSNPAQDQAITQRVAALRKANPDMTGPIPVDLLTASGSGLDPHISPAAAHYQAARVAKARNLPLDQVQTLIDEHVEKPILYFIGDPVVNVLQLNLALDASQTK